jgi:transglutaminase-like putative cysteine protease
MISTHLDLTVRIGCHLVYQTHAPTPAVFLLRPRLDDSHLVLAEARSSEPELACQEFIDAHGNTAVRTILPPGRTEIRADAMVAVSSRPEPQGADQIAGPVSEFPAEILRYTLPSRYCDSDKLRDFAWAHFGSFAHGYERVQAICQWVHKNIEYRFGSGSPELSAKDVIDRRHGVCRDFAHIVIALCRTFNLPARYVTGHLPEIGSIVSTHAEDFHAYCEVFLGDQWWPFDARFNVARIGRVKLAHGLDAVDAAFATLYGHSTLQYFEVWSYQVNPAEVSLADPIDLTKRWDGALDVRVS